MFKRDASRYKSDKREEACEKAWRRDVAFIFATDCFSFEYFIIIFITARYRHRLLFAVEFVFRNIRCYRRVIVQLFNFFLYDAI